MPGPFPSLGLALLFLSFCKAWLVRRPMNFIASSHFVTVALIGIGMRLIACNPGRIVITNLRNLSGVRWWNYVLRAMGV